MSRMTKFLKQTCQVEEYQLDEHGETLLDRFGSIVYNSPKTVKCRREGCIKDVLTANGSILKSSTRYFIDETQEIKADYRIDGKVVLTASEYINEKGTVEGYEVYC